MQTVALAATAVVLLCAAASADAVTLSRTNIELAAGACQAALPAFEGQIRKRPLAVQNEGTASAFITCAYEGPFISFSQSRRNFIGLVVRNNSAASLTIDCTFVDAGNAINSPVFFTRSITLGANQAGWDIAVAASDNGGNNFIYPAVSCNVPPGGGISGVAQRYDEDVGA